VRHLAPRREQLEQIVELAVDIAADGDGAVDGLDVGLLDKDLLDLEREVERWRERRRKRKKKVERRSGEIDGGRGRADERKERRIASLLNTRTNLTISHSVLSSSSSRCSHFRRRSIHSSRSGGAICVLV
jgi:hypothetical protein